MRRQHYRTYSSVRRLERRCHHLNHRIENLENMEDRLARASADNPKYRK